MALVRKLTAVRRVGHGGTLDPLATGVLPICLGRATRMSDLLLTARKRYTVDVRLGVTTDTYDAEGRVVREADASGVTREQVEAALKAFLGAIRQVPPMFSALKRGGQPLYKLARAGVSVEREPRPVEVYSLLLTRWSPPDLTLDVECSRGAYMRSLAHDLGEGLGCGAHMAGLTRTAMGPFTLAQSVSLEHLLDAAHGGYWQCLVEPLDRVVADLPAAILDPESLSSVRQGRLLPHDGAPAAARQQCRAYSHDGVLVALLSYDPSRHGWQPDKVLFGGP